MQYLKTSEFASRIGITAVTLRDWEKRGWLVPHHKSPTGYRYYTEEQAEEFLSGGLKHEKRSHS